jgi:DNA-binding protein HU-beta
MKNNAKLTAAVQAVTGQTKTQAEESIQAVLSSVKNLAVADGKLVIQDYGTFSNVARAARQGRNPKTGETM